MQLKTAFTIHDIGGEVMDCFTQCLTSAKMFSRYKTMEINDDQVRHAVRHIHGLVQGLPAPPVSFTALRSASQKKYLQR